VHSDIQQNSLIVTSDNTEILIIQHLSRVIREWKFLHFHLKTASLIKQPDLRDMLKSSKCVCTSTVVVSSDLLSPTPSTSSAMKIPESTEVDPDD